MSNFTEKYQQFMSNRNGPDRFARDMLILALVLFVLAVVFDGFVRSLFLILGIAAMAYSYFRLFSTDRVARSRENAAYVAKFNEVFAKVSRPFQGLAGRAKQASKKGQQMAEQAKDREHRYYACPKCGQTVRVPKGAGKIRVTCPKCGEKFEKKA